MARLQRRWQVRWSARSGVRVGIRACVRPPVADRTKRSPRCSIVLCSALQILCRPRCAWLPASPPPAPRWSASAATSRARGVSRVAHARGCRQRHLPHARGGRRPRAGVSWQGVADGAAGHLPSDWLLRPSPAHRLARVHCEVRCSGLVRRRWVGGGGGRQCVAAATRIAPSSCLFLPHLASLTLASHSPSPPR